MKKIHVFIGVAGSGKDYEAGRFIQSNGAVRVAFANSLRRDIWTMIGWSPESEQAYERFKVDVFTSSLGIRFTGRDLLLRYGTDIRRKEDNEVWCKRAIAEIGLALESHPEVVITDCRFKNEVEYLKQYALKNKIHLCFYFCNFHSKKYNPFIMHESEKLAQELVACGFEHLDERFDHFVKTTGFCHVLPLSRNLKPV